MQSRHGHGCMQDGFLTRFATRGLMSPFEVICGRAYRGKLVEFLEPILAYVHVQGQQKGLPKWEKAIFLSKTGMNDMFIVGLNGCIRLTHSVRRIPVPWSDASAIQLYSQMNVQPWQLEGVTGTRLLASKMLNQGVASAVEGCWSLLFHNLLHQEPQTKPQKTRQVKQKARACSLQKYLEVSRVRRCLSRRGQSRRG